MLGIAILSTIILVLLVYFKIVPQKIADFSYILALGISLSNDLLSTLISNILHSSFAKSYSKDNMSLEK